MEDRSRPSRRDRLGALLQRRRAIGVELLLVPLVLALKAAGVLRNPVLPFWLFGWLSLWARRIGWRGVGLTAPADWRRTVIAGAGIGLAYNAFDIKVVLPLLHRLTGEPLNLESVSGLAGNPGLLMLLLAATWSLFAFGEEMAYRGYLLNRMVDLFGSTRAGWTLSITLMSVAFGIAHLSQGVTGVLDNILGGAVLAALYVASGRNLWLPIIAHGIEDTSSLVLLYLGHRP